MSQFYARYVPPSRSAPVQVQSSASPPKRKRDETFDTTARKSKAKKPKVQTLQEQESRKQELKSPEQNQEKGSNILKKYSITGYAKDNGQHDIKERKTSSKVKKLNSSSVDTGIVETNYTLNGSAEVPTSTVEKHSTLLSKFAKSKRRSERLTAVDDPPGNDDASIEELEVHALEPIPQPVDTISNTKELTFATLPSWQANAITATKQETPTFDSMGLSKTMLDNLRKQDLVHTFPIQSTVIPLLTGSLRVKSDLCVSAATGSGKTLAYIIPIIEDLRRRMGTVLRAVIVVPTRELVKQVRESCELCAGGSNLKIVTAVGTNSMKDEQSDLVATEEIYNPAEYDRQQAMPVDWTRFDLVAELEKRRSKQAAPVPDFVTKWRSKADILITTPGRLVDHLKNTDGFNLDNIEWLVIDEADRLLNESYQEWVEVVVPALRSRNATKERDKLLQSMLMDLPPRVVHKVLLSATMTRDISKLNALELNDPKLIVLSATSSTGVSQIQSSNDTAVETAAHMIDEYTIPSGLSETVLAFKDGADKPLLLLQWIYEHIQPNNKERQGFKATVSKTANALLRNLPDESSSSSSSEDSSDESSGSDSGSSADSDDTSSISSSSSTSSDGSISPEAEARGKETKLSIRNQPERHRTPRALVFAKSTASASRLSRLLGLLSPQLEPKIATLTRSTASSASSRTSLASFQDGRVSILIATDRASRGIDVPGLENVVNYDIPGSAQTYVHRVGRTARAGFKGHGWTLVEHREGRWFWNEIGGKSETCKIQRSNRVAKLEVKADDADLIERYAVALQKLGEEVRNQ